MAKSIMIQGTMSNAGKSIVAAGLLRVFKQDGYKAAPFKSQNMALNSYITKDGYEMGRAQVMQAEAAGIEPDVCMNPILLKPTNDVGSQVIVNGVPVGNMNAAEYFEYKKNLVGDIKKAYDRLSKSVDIIVIEGAGSPAEINLKDNDIVNMGMAKIADAPVLLVGDIDRGGVFAQLIGTLMLLEEDELGRVKGLIINKFRGDIKLLEPGIKMLEDKAGIPVTGTLPYINISLDDEDSLSSRFDRKSNEALINIAVVRLPRISNFTDFNVFEIMEGVSVSYVDTPQDIYSADMVIIPGTKNTIADLIWMRQNGLEAAIKKFSVNHPVFGICGGYQMLGNMINDYDVLEQGGSIMGMGLIPMVTTLKKEKTRLQVSTRFGNVGGILKGVSGKMITGYEIHMGESHFDADCQPVTEAAYDNMDAGAHMGNVYGTYIHGVFDEGDIASTIVNILAKEKGVKYDTDKHFDYRTFKESQYDKLADMIRDNMDMDSVYRIMGIRGN